MPETVNNARSWGRIDPDTRYDLGSLDVRFEVPVGCSYDTMVAISNLHIKKAIEQWERLGDGKGHKWKHWDRIPPQYSVSHIPSQEMLDYFNGLKGTPESVVNENRKDFLAKAARELSGAMVAMTAKIWFVRPLTLVNLDEEADWKASTNEDMGYVTQDEMKKIIEENTVD